jgi:hypothetical protein
MGHLQIHLYDLFWKIRTFSKHFVGLSMSQLEKLHFAFWILKSTFGWNSNISFKNVVSSLLFLNVYCQQNNISRGPLLLQYPILLFETPLSRFSFVSHELYLGHERLHIKHTPLIITTLQISTVVCYKYLSWTFFNNGTYNTIQKNRTSQDRRAQKQRTERTNSLGRNYKLRTICDNVNVASSGNINTNTWMQNTRMYPKVPGLAAWSENCKWYSSLPLVAVVSLFCESV